MSFCHSKTMTSHNTNIYFEMDFSPGEEPDLPAEVVTDSRYLSPPRSRAISQPRNISRSTTVTPPSSVSPSSLSSSFFPKILRESFSKLLQRSGRSSEKENVIHSELDNYDDQILSVSGSTSPDTEEIVKESLKNGLPIIPFAYPTFFTTFRRQEADSKMRRKSKTTREEVNRKRRPPIGCDCEDEVFQMEHEEKSGELLQSLDSIVQMAKLQMEDEPPTLTKRQESQSSYVEMNPNSEVTEDFTEDSDYFCMDNTKTCNSLPENNRRSNTNIQREKGGLIENGFCRRFKKSKRHKEDYALFDFEGKSDYVKMTGSNKTWHFLDFSRKLK